MMHFSCSSKKASALSQLSGSTSVWLTRRAALISRSHAEQLSMERKNPLLSFSESHQRRARVARRLAPRVSTSYEIFAAVGPNIQARAFSAASNVLALAGQSLKRKKTTATRETKETKNEDSRTTNDSNANNVFRDRSGFGNARAVDFKGARRDPPNALTLSAGSARSREEARTIRSSKATRQLKKMPRDEREKFFSELQKSGNADVYHYSAMLSHAADSAQADSLLEQMAEAGVRPNIVTYNTLINKHQDSGQFDRANALLDRMRASGVRPDVVTYSSLIDGLSRSLRHRQAERLWSQMHAIGIQPDSRSYTIAVHMYCRMHRLSDARRSIAEMTARSLTPSAATYSPLFTLFGKDKDFEGLLELLSEMHAQNVAIDERAFQSILSAAAAMGLLNVVKAMSAEATAATATAATAAVKAEAAAVDAAARQDMPGAGKRGVAVTWSGDRIRQILEGACIETRERRLCERERGREGERESRCGKGPSPVMATLKEAGPDGVWGCIDGGDDVAAPARPAVEETETSQESRALIKRHGGSVDVTGAVGKGGGHALGGGSSYRGDGDGGIRVNVFHDEGGERERVAGASICGTSSEIALYGRRLEVESARAVFDAAQKSGSARVHEYTVMLHIYLRAGLREEAEDLFVEMLESGIRANDVTYATMIDGLASSGEATDALMAMQLFWQARSEGLLPFASFISRQSDGAILVDLHGMSALTSVIAVEFALAVKEGSFIAKERAFAGKDAQMVLVTGRGLHSKGGAAVVRPAVESFLKEHGIGFSTAADNEGRLVIERLSSSLPLVVFCSLLLGLMWFIGGVLAKQWVDIWMRTNAEAHRQRQVTRLRDELRRSLVQHSKGRELMLSDLKDLSSKR